MSSPRNTFTRNWIHPSTKSVYNGIICEFPSEKEWMSPSDFSINIEPIEGSTEFLVWANCRLNGVTICRRWCAQTFNGKLYDINLWDAFFNGGGEAHSLIYRHFAKMHNGCKLMVFVPKDSTTYEADLKDIHRFLAPVSETPDEYQWVWRIAEMLFLEWQKGTEAFELNQNIINQYKNS